ncbi:MAG: glycosyltransferase family 4 protein [Verrucomicrobia bacterium]|nr:glycosyltransferase family 4 protein [Kiritimatiellia bacterium]MCB1101025.1 glycosyltransferase family 4 protein [Kiritimatiellia bacterium]MCP5487848.1 glycosyltransferase family 4 protein [Verrucomicrobiota bacterium]
MNHGRIGFVSTRFAGTDGVSLESLKWARVLETLNYRSYWYAGLLDQDPEVSFCVPEAFFGFPENQWINERIWGRGHRDPIVTERILALADYLKHTIYRFVDHFGIEMLVLQNSVTIPMHVPLGLAITLYLAETNMPAIAHHHDFYWERTRFSVNAIPDLLDMAFPPRDVRLQHVVINEAAQESLALRKGVTSLLIPNVLDFETPPPPVDDYASDVRSQIGLEPGDVFILQPTRVVPRKGIEHAIKLVQMLGDPKYKLVISHEAGDEGFEYRNMLCELAREARVDLRFIATRVGETRQLDDEGRKIYTLNDVYPHADLVTYPSLYEGFGNAFLEAMYFRVPVLINRYSVFGRDIEPKGFHVPLMDGFVTRKVVEDVRRLIEDQKYRQAMTEHNFRVAIRYYSYSVLRRSLRTLITNVTGLTEM